MENSSSNLFSSSFHKQILIRYYFFGVAERIGIPFVSPYLKSIGSDFRHGANFATLASTVLLPQTSLFVSGLSPFALPIQLNQMKHFKAQVDELYSKGKLR